MSGNQQALDWKDEPLSDSVAFTIVCGSPELARLFARELKHKGFRDDPDASIYILLDAPHRFALDFFEKTRFPDTRRLSQRFIAVTSAVCPEYLEDLWDMGLAGLLAGGSLEYDLPKLIISVASGEQYRITTVPTTVLSLCERQVLRLLADGLKNEQIAERLSRSYQGVKNVVGHIFQKLHLNSREEAILYYWSVKPSVMDRQ